MVNDVEIFDAFKPANHSDGQRENHHFIGRLDENLGDDQRTDYPPRQDSGKGCREKNQGIYAFAPEGGDDGAERETAVAA